MRSVVSAIQDTIPFSMFNQGLAGKIFSNVKAIGAKVVMKNNRPEVVIVPPEEYVREKEELENLRLLLLAAERMEHYNADTLVSQEEVDRRFNFTEEELSDFEEVEIE